MTKNNTIPKILQFIKGASLQESSKPGFQHALRLSYNLIEKEKLEWNKEDDCLTYRYQFRNGSIGSPTAGVLFAIMDELQTNALFGANQPSAPGLTLQMQLESVCAKRLSSCTELDVVCRVDKSGKTVSNICCDFFDVDGNLMSYGSQVKFMPTGSAVTDLVFNEGWAWNLYNGVVLKNREPDQYEVKSLTDEVISPYLRYDSVCSATFEINSEHINPLGGLHVSVSQLLCV